MKKLLGAAGILGIIGMTSCVDHQVIPPPLPMVDLNCECEALIDDSLVAYNDTCTYQSQKVISTSSPSEAQYFTNIQEETMTQGLELEMRSVTWNDDGTNNPPLTVWETFFNANTEPAYSTNIVDMGVVVRWTDPNLKVWTSDTVTVGNACAQNFTYESFVLESDTTGDYMQFKAIFNGVLLNSDYGVVDSAKCIENAVVRSAFKLE
ncbi:MAG: hypothetical protein MK078_02940 [Crocinitomicaceae bacterium]|nr:hypothetical protein [Crocinitomicaceae bacterium]